jgi:hypothetical protein
MADKSFYDTIQDATLIDWHNPDARIMSAFLELLIEAGIPKEVVAEAVKTALAKQGITPAEVEARVDASLRRLWPSEIQVSDSSSPPDSAES